MMATVTAPCRRRRSGGRKPRQPDHWTALARWAIALAGESDLVYVLIACTGLLDALPDRARRLMRPRWGVTVFEQALTFAPVAAVGGDARPRPAVTLPCTRLYCAPNRAAPPRGERAR